MLVNPVLTTSAETGLFMTTELKRQTEEDKKNLNQTANIIFTITIVNFVRNFYLVFVLENYSQQVKILHRNTLYFTKNIDKI